MGKEGSDLKRSLTAIGHEYYISISSIDCLVDLIGYVVHSLHRVLILNIIFRTHNLIFLDRLIIDHVLLSNVRNKDYILHSFHITWNFGFVMMFTISLHGNCCKLMMRNIVNVTGLAEAAAALQREANLPRSITPPNVLPAQPCVFSSPHLASPRIVSFTLH